MYSNSLLVVVAMMINDHEWRGAEVRRNFGRLPNGSGRVGFWPFFPDPRGVGFILGMTSTRPDSFGVPRGVFRGVAKQTLGMLRPAKTIEKYFIIIISIIIIIIS